MIANLHRNHVAPLATQQRHSAPIESCLLGVRHLHLEGLAWDRWVPHLSACDESAVACKQAGLSVGAVSHMRGRRSTMLRVATEVVDQRAVLLRVSHEKLVQISSKRVRVAASEKLALQSHHRLHLVSFREWLAALGSRGTTAAAQTFG